MLVTAPVDDRMLLYFVVDRQYFVVVALVVALCLLFGFISVALSVPLIGETQVPRVP